MDSITKDKIQAYEIEPGDPLWNEMTEKLYLNEYLEKVVCDIAKENRSKNKDKENVIDKKLKSLHEFISDNYNLLKICIYEKE